MKFHALLGWVVALGLALLHWWSGTAPPEPIPGDAAGPISRDSTGLRPGREWGEERQHCEALEAEVALLRAAALERQEHDEQEAAKDREFYHEYALSIVMTRIERGCADGIADLLGLDAARAELFYNGCESIAARLHAMEQEHVVCMREDPIKKEVEIGEFIEEAAPLRREWIALIGSILSAAEQERYDRFKMEAVLFEFGFGESERTVTTWKDLTRASSGHGVPKRYEDPAPAGEPR